MRYLVLFLLVSFNIYANDTIKCVCNMDIGYPGSLESQDTINQEVHIDINESSILEATDAEIQVEVSYQCLNDFKKTDMRKLYKLNSVTCEF